MRIPSGSTDRYIYFVAVDSTDLKTRETGLSSFTVYRSRNGGAATVMTTPTVNETDSTNMPGVYELLLDEDTTLDAGDDAQAMVFHITQASMAPVTIAIEIYRPETTEGNTLGVESDGDLTKVNTLDGHTAQTGDSFARIGVNGAGLSAVPWNLSWDAEVQSECNDALVALGLDHLVSVAVVGSDVADDSIIARLVSSSATADWDDFANTTDSLQALRDRGDAAWTTATGFSTHSAADVWTSGGRTLTAATNITSDGTAITMSSSGVVGTVNLVNTTTTNTDMRGTNSAYTGTPPTAAAITTAVLTTQMSEAYNADGTAPTLAQALFVTMQAVTEFAISGTTKTVKKLDGSTTAYTETLDDSSSPTSITRAT